MAAGCVPICRCICKLAKFLYMSTLTRIMQTVQLLMQFPKDDSEAVSLDCNGDQIPCAIVTGGKR